MGPAGMLGRLTGPSPTMRAVDPAEHTKLGGPAPGSSPKTLPRSISGRASGLASSMATVVPAEEPESRNTAGPGSVRRSPQGPPGAASAPLTQQI